MGNNSSHPTDAQLVMALDGELESSELAFVTSHVESCECCRAKWEGWQRTSAEVLKYHRGPVQALVPAFREPAARPVVARMPSRSWLWRGAAVAAAVACVCAIWFLRKPEGRPVTAAKEAVVSNLTQRPVVEPERPAPPASRPASHRRVHKQAPPDLTASDIPSFVALPYSDNAFPLRDATILRVQVPVDQLWLAGFKVAGGGSGGMVEADVLMGIDGSPRAIRLLQ